MSPTPKQLTLNRATPQWHTPINALRLYACLVLVGAVMSATQVIAAPAFTPFLAVDVDGYNAGGGQSLGPSEAGYQGWEAAEGLFLDPSIDWGNSGAAGLTKVFATSEGNITANMIGVTPNSFRGARNRGANSDALGALTQDFVFAQRDAAAGLGQHIIRLSLAGLTPGQQYEVTAFARDHFNGGADSFQAWTDRAALGGLDGPGAWMNANIGPGATYQPAPGGVNNPIPTFARSPLSGPSSADPYAYAATFLSAADAGGVLTFYGWADPNSFSGVQSATLLNGFQIAVAVPEPGTLVLVGAGLIGLLIRRRRSH
jgi:hypothetical protein